MTNWEWFALGAMSMLIPSMLVLAWLLYKSDLGD